MNTNDFFFWTQDTTPLAGSSAGAIVCAVIASGASVQEALKATKLLAQDCRLNGTAFRLGVCWYCKCGLVNTALKGKKFVK